MARRIVDISVALQAGIASDAPMLPPQIDYRDHRQTAPVLASLCPGPRADRLPDGEGRAVENVRISTRNCAHLDARYVHGARGGGGTDSHRPRSPCSTSCSSTPPPRMAGPIISTRVAAWAARRRSISPSAACA